MTRDGEGRKHGETNYATTSKSTYEKRVSEFLEGVIWRSAERVEKQQQLTEERKRDGEERMDREENGNRSERIFFLNAEESRGSFLVLFNRLRKSARSRGLVVSCPANVQTRRKRDRGRGEGGRNV